MMDDWKNKWMGELMIGWMSYIWYENVMRMDDWLDEWLDELVGVWPAGGVDGWVSVWMDGWMPG